MALLAYCKLAELADDPEVVLLLDTLYGAAAAYMSQAGIAEPPEGSPRRALYDLCVNRLVLDSWERRDVSVTSTVIHDNPAFRQTLTQLKLTEGAM